MVREDESAGSQTISKMGRQSVRYAGPVPKRRNGQNTTQFKVLKRAFFVVRCRKNNLIFLLIAQRSAQHIGRVYPLVEQVAIKKRPSEPEADSGLPKTSRGEFRRVEIKDASYAQTLSS